MLAAISYSGRSSRDGGATDSPSVGSDSLPRVFGGDIRTDGTFVSVCRRGLRVNANDSNAVAYTLLNIDEANRRANDIDVFCVEYAATEKN